MRNFFQRREHEIHYVFGRREQTLELLVFLFLIVPSMAFSFFSSQQGSPIGFPLVAAGVILNDLALVSLIFYFIWRNRETVWELGWDLRRAWREILWGVVLFPPFFVGASLVEHLLASAGLSTPARRLPGFLTVERPDQYILALFMVVVVAFSEETIFRGYLIRRFSGTIGSVAAAVILSSVVFSIGHGYEGTAGVITVGLMGVVFALIFLWRKSLVAPALMHFLQDSIGIVILPLLK